MKVNIKGYLPSVIGRIPEYQNIAATDDEELRKLWGCLDGLLDNQYILSCDEDTIAYYERLLELTGNQSMPLEDRRRAVLMKYNMKVLYTFPMLKELLAEAVGEENYRAECLYGTYQLMIQIMNQGNGLARNVYKMVALVKPANLELLFFTRHQGGYNAEVTYSERVEFITSFYPRFNLPTLLLDTTWKLDGSRRLNGINSETPVDLYPVSAGFRPSVSAKVLDGRRFCLKGSTYVQTRSGAQARIETSARQQTMALECLEVAAEARQDIGAGTITVHNQNILSSSWKLDGSRKLNGGIYTR